MAQHASPLDDHATKALAQDCADVASRRLSLPKERDPCFQLFVRALADPPNQQAWEAIVSQYYRLVALWLGKQASEDALQEVFLRFWRAQRHIDPPFSDRFPNQSAVMGYLKSCALTVRVEIGRQIERQQKLLRRLQEHWPADSLSLSLSPHAHLDRIRQDIHLKQLIRSKINHPLEQVVFEMTYYYDLRPREIQALQPDLFPDAKAVSRIKENLLKRLRRDPDVQALWGSDH